MESRTRFLGIVACCLATIIAITFVFVNHNDGLSEQISVVSTVPASIDSNQKQLKQPIDRDGREPIAKKISEFAQALSELESLAAPISEPEYLPSEPPEQLRAKVRWGFRSND